MNDEMAIQHIAAGKIAEAVWGNKAFKTPVKEIKLLDDTGTVESRNMKVYKTLKAKGLV